MRDDGASLKIRETPILPAGPKSMERKGKIKYAVNCIVKSAVHGKKSVAHARR